MGCSLLVLGQQGLDLGLVGLVRDKVRHLFAHVLFCELEEAINLLPELLLGRHGSSLFNLDVSEVHGIEDAHASLEALITLKVSQLASLGKGENAERWVVGHANEVIEHPSVVLADTTLVDGLSEPNLEGMFTVVLPHALEVWLFGDLGGHLVWHDHVFLFDDLGSELAKSLILCLESCSALWRASVHAKHDVLVLVGLGEGVEDAVALRISVSIKNVASLAPPAHLGNLIVEETVLESTSPVLHAEPLKWVRLLTFTSKLLGSPFGLKIKHGVIPGLARVGINIPAVLVLVLSPIGYAEALEDGPGASVEGNVSDALKKGVWVEVLGVHVMHDIGLLVELVAVYILDAKSYIIIKNKNKHHWLQKHDDNKAAGLVALVAPHRFSTNVICRQSAQKLTLPDDFGGPHSIRLRYPEKGYRAWACVSAWRKVTYLPLLPSRRGTCR